MLVIASCTDREPVGPRAGAPEAQISDAVHSAGNAHFFFLPPLVPAPSTSGTFDGSLSPVVQICTLGASGCLTPLVAQFMTTTGPGSETVRVDPTAENYIVNWHTDQFTLDPVYALTLAGGATQLLAHPGGQPDWRRH